MATGRAYWKGYLKLSLVTCPVALYPASSQAEKTHFHQINRKTGNRLRQQMVDEETGKTVDKEQKGRGYEVSKGKYVEIEPEELEAVEIESTHTIDIDTFVPEEEIDKRYYERPYYIVPDGKSGEEAFAVIRDAMKDKGRVALARIVFANREHIMAIEPWGKGMLGTTLRYDYEVRDEREVFKGIPSPRVPKEMVQLAVAHPRQEGRAFRSGQVQGRVRAGAAQAGQAQGSGQDDRAARAGGRSLQRHRPHGCPAAEPQRQWCGDEKSAQKEPGQRTRATQEGRLSRWPKSPEFHAVSFNVPLHGGWRCGFGRPRSAAAHAAGWRVSPCRSARSAAADRARADARSDGRPQRAPSCPQPVCRACEKSDDCPDARGPRWLGLQCRRWDRSEVVVRNPMSNNSFHPCLRRWRPPDICVISRRRRPRPISW